MLQKFKNNLEQGGDNKKEIERIIDILEKVMLEYEMRPDHELKRDKKGLILEGQEKIKNKFTAGYIMALFGWADVLFQNFTPLNKEKFVAKKKELAKRIGQADRITELDIKEAEELTNNIISEYKTKKTAI